MTKNYKSRIRDFDKSNTIIEIQKWSYVKFLLTSTIEKIRAGGTDAK